MTPPSSRSARDLQRSKSKSEFLSANGQQYLSRWLLPFRTISFDCTSLVKLIPLFF